MAALESGELARLRVVAQRRLEKLRIERAAVADLRERLDAAANDLEELQWAEWRAVEARDVALAELRETEQQLSDTRSHLRDALEELAKANAKLAAAARPKPGDLDLFNVDRNAAAAVQALRDACDCKQEVRITEFCGSWYARSGRCGGYGLTPIDALAALGRNGK